MIYIETERLILRDWIRSDEVPFIKLNNDEKVMQFFPAILTAQESLQLIEKIKKHFATYGYGLFAVERKDNKKFIGFTGLSHPLFTSNFTPCVEIGWRLNHADWNKGFATEAAKACIQYGFDKLEMKEIYSFTSVHNNPSEKVMKKIGMKLEGIFDHPVLEENHYLKPHVLYKISK